MCRRSPAPVRKVGVHSAEKRATATLGRAVAAFYVHSGQPNKNPIPNA